MIGLSIMFIWGISELVRKYRIARYATLAVGIIAVLLYGSLGYQQVQIWESNETLYTNTLRYDPYHPLANNNLGTHYMLTREYGNARECFQRTIAVTPAYATAYHNIGMCYLHEELPDSALTYFTKALARKPEYPEAMLFAGVAHTDLGNYRQAESYLVRARKLAPESVRPHYFLAKLYREEHRYALAERNFIRALETDPTVCEIYRELGLMLVDGGKIEGAKRLLSKAGEFGCSVDTVRTKIMQLSQ